MTARPTVTRLLLVVAPTYAEAETLMRGRILPIGIDWHWISSERTALRWLARCERRGEHIDPVWLYPANTWERIA